MQIILLQFLQNNLIAEEATITTQKMRPEKRWKIRRRTVHKMTVSIKVILKAKKKKKKKIEILNFLTLYKIFWEVKKKKSGGKKLCFNDFLLKRLSTVYVCWCLFACVFVCVG